MSIKRVIIETDDGDYYKVTGCSHQVPKHLKGDGLVWGVKLAPPPRCLDILPPTEPEETEDFLLFELTHALIFGAVETN
jgi:hypothetical protein